MGASGLDWLFSEKKKPSAAPPAPAPPGGGCSARGCEKKKKKKSKLKMFVTKMKKKMSRVVDRVVPCPLSISLSLLPFCCCTDHLLYIHLVEMNSLSPFFAKKKTPSKPSSYPLHPHNLIILFYVIFFIFFLFSIS